MWFMDFPEALAAINTIVFLAATVVNGLSVWRGWQGGRDWALLAIPVAVALTSLWTAVSYIMILIAERPFQINVTMLRPAMMLIGLIFLAIPTYLYTVRQAMGEAGHIQEVLSEARQCREQLKTLHHKLIDLEQTNSILREAYQALRERERD
jgi:hypothetical protein